MARSNEDKLDLVLFGMRCAWCRRPLDSLPQFDHVVSSALGGGNERANRVPACARCNQTKGQRGPLLRDPYDGAHVQIFHPRRDRWDDHFEIRHGRALGKSPRGRATARLLWQGESPPREPSPSWTPIEYCSDEHLGLLLESLVRAHDANDSAGVAAYVMRLDTWESELNDVDDWLRRLAMKWFPAMQLLKSARRVDIERNLRLATENYEAGLVFGAPVDLEERFRLEWLGLTLLHAGALHASKASRRLAERYITRAARTYVDVADHPRLDQERLRWRALANQFKIEPGPVPAVAPFEEDIARQLSQNRFQLVGDIAEAAARSTAPTKTIEQVYEMVDHAVQRSGYAAGGDVGESSELRRRWWMLRFRLALTVNGNLLAEDRRYWKARRLYGELRLSELDERDLRPL